MSLLSQPLPVSLDERMRDAGSSAPALVTDIIGETRRILLSPWLAAGSTRISQLVRLGAWTDAALELIELELPQWKIRRLAYDGGEWYCALSKQREMPDWLDQAIECHHQDLASAILSALIEARGQIPLVPAASTHHSPADALFEPMLSDNFV